MRNIYIYATWQIYAKFRLIDFRTRRNYISAANITRVRLLCSIYGIFEVLLYRGTIVYIQTIVDF